MDVHKRRPIVFQTVLPPEILREVIFQTRFLLQNLSDCFCHCFIGQAFGQSVDRLHGVEHLFIRCQRKIFRLFQVKSSVFWFHFSAEYVDAAPFQYCAQKRHAKPYHKKISGIVFDLSGDDGSGAGFLYVQGLTDARLLRTFHRPCDFGYGNRTVIYIIISRVIMEQVVGGVYADFCKQFLCLFPDSFQFAYRWCHLFSFIKRKGTVYTVPFFTQRKLRSNRWAVRRN